jgi:hypothetical protein
MVAAIKSAFLDKLRAEGGESDWVKALTGSWAVGCAHGEALGRAETILLVLDARGIAVPAEIRDQVLDCTGIAQLDAWAERAATAETVSEVFGEVSGRP